MTHKIKYREDTFLTFIAVKAQINKNAPPLLPLLNHRSLLKQ